jgi:MFS transporter, FHS family, L-fucose permease
MTNTSSYTKVLPVFFGFFIMGFVDVVGISTNYIKGDFHLSNSVANLLPMMVFAWFFVFSIPTGLLMNKLGRKNVVLLSMAFTLIAMLIPFFTNTFSVMLIAFAFLGIGNTILQVSLNPLLSNIISGDKLTSSLTFGQFIKAIAAFLGPIIASFAASSLGNWKYIFPLFAAITLVSTIWLFVTPIKEEQQAVKTYTFAGCLKLLADPVILMLFLGIVFVVGVDVGLNVTIPKVLMERCNMLLEDAGLGTSLYFIARTAGAFLGALLLIKLKPRNFFIVSMIVAIIAMALFLKAQASWAILTLVFIVGFAIANVFSIIFAAALRRLPERANEISGLMIMGIAGGAIFPLIMGTTADAFGQSGALAVLLIAVVYLLFTAFKVKEA